MLPPVLSNRIPYNRHCDKLLRKLRVDPVGYSTHEYVCLRARRCNETVGLNVKVFRHRGCTLRKARTSRDYVEGTPILLPIIAVQISSPPSLGPLRLLTAARS